MSTGPQLDSGFAGRTPQWEFSRHTLLHTLRTGEVLPPALRNEEELELIRKEPAPVVMKLSSAARAGETSVVSRER